MTDRTTPKPHTEAALVCRCMLDSRVVSSVSDLLAPEDFRTPGMANIWRAIIKQWTAGEETQPTALAEHLSESELDLAFDCYGQSGTSLGAMPYAKKIKDASTRRHLAGICEKVEHRAKHDPAPVAEILGAAQSSVLGVDLPQEDQTASDVLIEIMKDSEEASKKGVLGIPTGYKVMDNALGGLRAPNYIVLAARPSIGKTAFALNLAYNIVLRTSENVGFIQAEMSKKECYLRLLARHMDMNGNRLMRGDLDREGWVKYQEGAADLQAKLEGRIFMDDKGHPSAGHIRARAMQWKQQHDIGVLFVDQIQALSCPGADSSVERLSQLSRAHKALAKDMNIPVVLLSQLSRAAEGRDEMKDPSLPDLKGSGSIEEDADVVIFVHRPGREAVNGRIIIGKNRNGPVGHGLVDYKGSRFTFNERKK